MCKFLTLVEFQFQTQLQSAATQQPPEQLEEKQPTTCIYADNIHRQIPAMVLFNVHMHCNYIVTKDSLISTIAKAIFTQCWIAFAIQH